MAWRALLLLLASCAGIPFDLIRARAPRPRAHVTASTPAAIRELLNSRLVAAAPATLACEEFSLAEIQAVLEGLFVLRDAAVVDALAPGDARRPRHDDFDSLAAENAAHAAAAAADPLRDGAGPLRDAKCFEAAMSWVHHLSDDGRAEAHAMLGPVPLLPRATDAAALDAALDAAAARAGDDDAAAAFDAVREAGVVSCETGHNATAVAAGEWQGFPDWPDELTYHARGYGPYPFWYANSAASGDITGAGANITTFWSALKNAERLEHAACATGGASDGAPCTHLFVDRWAALFAADESWCCWSSTPNLPNCWMSTVSRDFYKLFTYRGESDGYVSESGLYVGKVHNYTMTLDTNPNFWFWYYTDADGFPVEQGEGGCVTPRGCHGVKYLFHQFDRDTFRAQALDESLFEFPDVCKSSTDTCTVSPNSLCSA